jgi:hypothetical protein
LSLQTSKLPQSVANSINTINTQSVANNINTQSINVVSRTNIDVNINKEKEIKEKDNKEKDIKEKDNRTTIGNDKVNILVNREV